jgi:hypothetical protein
MVDRGASAATVSFGNYFLSEGVCGKAFLTPPKATFIIKVKTITRT